MSGTDTTGIAMYTVLFIQPRGLVLFSDNRIKKYGKNCSVKRKMKKMGGNSIIAALKIEVKGLKTENARLRSLLGAREKRAERNKTPLAKAILKAFEGKETLMIGEMIKSVSETLSKNVKKATVYQCLYRLQKAGIVEQKQKGVYALKGE